MNKQYNNMRLTKDLYDNYPSYFINGKAINDYIKRYYPEDELGYILFKADAQLLGLTEIINKLNLYINNKNNILYNINLIGDAKSKLNRFAICSEDGKPLYYGKFFEGIDNNFNIDQGQEYAELYALKYALQLITDTCKLYKIKSGSVHLNYFTDNKSLVETNVSKVSFLSHQLKKWSKEYQIQFDLYWIRGCDNCADEYTLDNYTFLYPQLELTKNYFQKIKN